jgi:hypothetical protein
VQLKGGDKRHGNEEDYQEGHEEDDQEEEVRNPQVHFSLPDRSWL